MRNFPNGEKRNFPNGEIMNFLKFSQMLKISLEQRLRCLQLFAGLLKSRDEHDSEHVHNFQICLHNVIVLFRQSQRTCKIYSCHKNKPALLYSSQYDLFQIFKKLKTWSPPKFNFEYSNAASLENIEHFCCQFKLIWPEMCPNSSKTPIKSICMQNNCILS